MNRPERIPSHELLRAQLETHKEDENPILDESELRIRKHVLGGARILEMEHTPEKVELSEGERERIAARLENASWGKLFNGLKDGGNLAIFGRTEGPKLKALNSLLGERNTDIVMGYKNMLIRELLSVSLEDGDTRLQQLVDLEMTDADFHSKMSEVFPEEKQNGHETLSQDVKFTYTRIDISDEPEERQKALTHLEKVAKAASELVRKRIVSMLEQRREGQEKDNPRLAGEINKALVFLEEEGSYALSYGLASVEKGDGEDFTNTVDAVVGATQALKMAGTGDASVHGAEYSREVVGGRFTEAVKIAEKYKGDTVSFRDIDGLDPRKGDIAIFVEDEDSPDELFLNPELYDLFRRGDVVSLTGKGELVDDIQEYVEAMNLVDIVKPMTMDEVRGKEKMANGYYLGDHLEVLGDHAASVREGEADTEEIQLVGKELALDSRDFITDSREKFHAGAMSFDHAGYVSLDVIALSKMQFRVYEKYNREVVAGNKTLEEASREAADELTRALRKFKDAVTSGTGAFLGGESEVFSHAGGDELKLAFDAKTMDQQRLDLLIKQIHNAISASQSGLQARITSVAIGTSERKSEKDHTFNRKIKDHNEAYKAAEDAHEESKYLEKRLRQVEDALSVIQDDPPGVEWFGAIKEMVYDIGWPPPVVIGPGGDKIVVYYKNGEDPLHIPFDEFKDNLNTLLEL